MTPGFSHDLDNVDDSSKTDFVSSCWELSRLEMDVVALQETRLPVFGFVEEKEFSYLWHGKGFIQGKRARRWLCC